MKASSRIRIARRAWGVALTTALVCSLVPTPALAEAAGELAATEEASVPADDDIVAEDRDTNETETGEGEIVDDPVIGDEDDATGDAVVIEDSVAEDRDTNETETVEDEENEPGMTEESAGPVEDEPSPTDDEYAGPARAAAEDAPDETPETKAKNLATATVAQIARQTYTGSALKPKVTVTLGGVTLAEGRDYTLSYSSNVNAGTARVTATGKGDYTGSTSTTFQIAPAQVSGATIAKIANQGYTGKAKKPKPTVTFGGVTLAEGRDYTLSYKNNKKKGTAKVTVTGKGNFAGTKVAKFKIVDRKTVKAKKVKVKVSTAYYAEGRAVKPAVKVTYKGKRLVEGVDYTLSYKSNQNVGTAKVTVKGKGAWKGTKTKSFKIKKCPVSKCAPSHAKSAYYTGSAVKPAVRLSHEGRALKAGRDYSLTYSGNVSAGTAKIVVKGKGNYTGSRTLTFSIVRRNLSASATTVSAIADQTYTGSAITPSPAVKYDGKALVVGRDYTFSYANNVSVGTATVTVTGKGVATGSRKVSFKIVPADIAKATVVPVGNQEYTGSALTPKPEVTFGGRTLVEGVDYALGYADNVNVGNNTAKITVTGKGNFTGVTGTAFGIGHFVVTKAAWDEQVKVVDKPEGVYRYKNTTGHNLYLAQPTYNDDDTPTCSRLYERIFNTRAECSAYIFEMMDQGYSLSSTFFIPNQWYSIYEAEEYHYETVHHPAEGFWVVS